MGEPFNSLLDWLGNCGLDKDLEAFECGECPASECDGCCKHDYMNEVADQICTEMQQLGERLAREWVEVNDEGAR